MVATDTSAGGTGAFATYEVLVSATNGRTDNADGGFEVLTALDVCSPTGLNSDRTLVQLGRVHNHDSPEDRTMTMPRMFRALMVALLFSSISILAAETSPALTGAQAVDEAWRKAITANDLDGIMAVYSENAVMWLPDAPEAKGREAIRKSYEDLLAGNTVTAATFANAHYETSGDHSVGWGDFTLSMSPKSGGNPMTLSGRFSVIARKEAGTWVYVVDHASAHPASPKPR